MPIYSMLYVGGPQFDSTSTLKTGPRGMISNVIKDLSVSSSSLIGFEVEWHSTVRHFKMPFITNSTINLVQQVQKFSTK